MFPIIGEGWLTPSAVALPVKFFCSIFPAEDAGPSEWSGAVRGVELILVLGLRARVLRRLGDLYTGIILSRGSIWQEFVGLTERRGIVEGTTQPRRELERIVMVRVAHVIAIPQIVIPRKGREIEPGELKDA